MSRLARTCCCLLLAWSLLGGASGCVSLKAPAANEIPPPYEPVVKQTALSESFRQALGPHSGMSGLRIVNAGIEGLLIRIELIDRAQDEIDLQYYIFRSDDSGKRLQQALVRAADRGVHVRIIADDGETVKGDEKLLLLSAHPGIEVRMFNPFHYRGHNGFLRAVDFLFYKSRLDYRMHNKLMVVDGAVALTGGRNIGDQYFQVDPESQFGDDDVLAVGPVVRRLETEFAQYWNSPIVVSASRLMLHKVDSTTLALYRQELAAPHPLLEMYATAFDQRLRAGEPLRGILADDSMLTWANATLIYDSPEKKKVRKGERVGGLLYPEMADRIGRAHSQLWIVTPYLVPMPSELQLLSQEVEHSVDVRILTNSLMSTPDVLAQAGYARYRPSLLENGVKLYEIRSNLGNTRGSGETRKIARFGTYALHAKLFVFDHTSVFIGSLNLDQRSVRLNTEMGLIIDSDAMASIVIARFNALASHDNAYEVARDDPPHHSAPRLVWRTREKGEVVTYRTEPARSKWQRIEMKFLSLLPLDPEL
jgi:putative cardiolipin synthase